MSPNPTQSVLTFDEVSSGVGSETNGRTKTILGLDREEQEDMDPSSEEDELVDSQDARRGRRNGARKGRLGDWEKIGWMAAKMYRRVPGIEFM